MNRTSFISAWMGAISLLALTGCATDIPADRRNQELIPASQRAVGLRDARPETILLMGQKSQLALQQKLKVNANNVSLIRILNSVAPNMEVVADDNGVDLSTHVSAQVRNGTLGSLLKQLTANANYAFHVEGNTIHVASRETKTWNLATFSTGQSSSGSVGDTQDPSSSNSSSSNGGLSSGSSSSSSSSSMSSSSNGSGNGSTTGGITTQVQNDEDDWNSIVDTARAMLGLPQVSNGGDNGSSKSGGLSANSGSGQNGNNGNSASAAAFNDDLSSGVVAIRSMGLIRATGQPRKIQQLDKWLSHLQQVSTEQYHLDVKTMEVTLNNDTARGINWQALANNAIHSTTGAIGFSGPISPSSFNSTAGGISGNLNVNDDVKATFQFLSQYGNVNLVNEPNVTVTNGRTANITTGRQFSYVGTIQQTVVQGGTTLTNPELDRILVGVKLAITPRELDDGRISLTVVPVISSLQGFTTIKTNGNEFKTPNVRLQSLATQVITRPGVPVHIGGLINSRIQDTLNTLPVREKLLANPLKYLFTSKQNSMQRRELVIMITPTKVDP